MVTFFQPPGVDRKHQTEAHAWLSFSLFTLTKQTLLNSKWKELTRNKQ